jgi:hypothetical protein
LREETLKPAFASIVDRHYRIPGCWAAAFYRRPM